MASEPQAKRVKIAGPAVLNSNEVITFHLLHETKGTAGVEVFRPEMSHQLFEEEEVKGYEDLQIDIFFSPAFQTLVECHFAGAPEKGATDLAAAIKVAFDYNFFKTKAEFDKALEEEPPLRAADLGTPITSAETTENTTMQILHCNLATASDSIRSLHARLQPLLLFYVDAASLIDSSDPAWDLLLAVETSSDDDSCRVLGFSTLYHFWVFPDRQRIRISQVLVLPPQQGRGVGSLLMEAAYLVADEQAAVDITIEDPTDDVQRLRDKMDLKRMMGAEWPQKEAEEKLQSTLQGKGDSAGAGASSASSSKATTPPSSSSAPSPLAASPEFLLRLQKELRISRKQAGRMWEGLLYAVAVPQGPKATAAVGGLIQALIEAQVSSAKQDTQGKIVREIEGGGFVMHKSKKKGSPAELAAPGAVPVEGVTADQQRDAIEDAVAVRVHEMKRLVGVAIDEAEDGDDCEEEEEKEG